MGGWFESAEGLKWPCWAMIWLCLQKNFLFRCICFSCLFCFFSATFHLTNPENSATTLEFLFPSFRGTFCYLDCIPQLDVSRPVTLSTLDPNHLFPFITFHINFLAWHWQIFKIWLWLPWCLISHILLLLCVSTEWGYPLFSESALPFFCAFVLVLFSLPRILSFPLFLCASFEI